MQAEKSACKIVLSPLISFACSSIAHNRYDILTLSIIFLYCRTNNDIVT